MYYKSVFEKLNTGDQARVATNLLALREALASQVPAKTINDRLLLATWNIREFGGKKYGGRLRESYAYIAEIVSHFDLIAIQEVRSDLNALRAIRSLLGSWWKVVYTDVTEGRPGNDERLAFLYDSRTVAFDGLAGELVLPEKAQGEMLQFARTPFSCGFRAGWKRIELSTVHIYYGTDKPDDPRRVREIAEFAKFLAKRGKKHKGHGDPHTIVLGDFNIFGHDDRTFEALTSAGFMIPEQLQEIPGSNVPKNRHYDQIAFLRRQGNLQSTAAGVFDFFEYVFRHDKKATGHSDANVYSIDRKKFGQWRTYQMSDHLVMWTSLEVDATENYLESFTRS